MKRSPQPGAKNQLSYKAIDQCRFTRFVISFILQTLFLSAASISLNVVRTF